MQRSTTVNAQDLCGFLELLLVGLVFIHIFIVVVIFILVAAAGRSVSLPLLSLAAASSLAGAFLAGSSSTFWAFSLSRRSYSAFCCSTSCSTFLQL